MKKILILFIGLLIFSSLIPLNSQDIISNSSVTGVCYAGNKTTRIYIPPPDEFYKKNRSKGGGSITFYYSGFSKEAVAAMEYAASILEAMLPADTRLTILASYTKMSSSDVLGNSSMTYYVGGWSIDALDPMAYYPISLAEKIAGESLNADAEGDLVLNINSNAKWYLGIDGATPGDLYDLVTVVLHEVCHGLGFFDSMDTDSSVGWYGFNSIPMIYDTFIENLEEKRLTDTLKFTNYSVQLRSQLIGNKLFFNGPLLKNYSGGRAQLYVPAEWDKGSSVSHLDEKATADSNSLMTPFIDMGEAIHDPGKLTFSILGDLGWINTRLSHKQMKSTEEYLSEIEISVTIKSDTLYNHDNVGLVYSFDQFNTSDTIVLSSPSDDDIYTTVLNVPSYNTEIQYYFFAEDYFKRIYRSPSMPDLLRYSVLIGTDTIDPTITHTPVGFFLGKVDTINFNASVSDRAGVDTVYVEYKVNEGQSKYLGLKVGTSGNYSAYIDALSESLKGGDSVQYRIIAIDSALVPNTAILPKTGYFVINIVAFKSTVESYSTDFSNSADDFFNKGFEVKMPVGFSKSGLHTLHPYESPEDNNKTIDYTAVLLHPVKFSGYGMLVSYQEIVLVEPGEAGSVYGSEDFYDYVILEASKDFGKNWFGLLDGYDSRYISLWETTYNNSIVEMNSTAAGLESMLRKHSLYYQTSDIFSEGDTLLLRFRLFSDPFANGWGWVIEDFKINPLIDAVEKTKDIPLIIYPNPGKGIIRINSGRNGLYDAKPLRYSIYNSTGTCIINNQNSVNSDILVDISSYPGGLYIIVLYRDDGITTLKYTLTK